LFATVSPKVLTIWKSILEDQPQDQLSKWKQELYFLQKHELIKQDRSGNWKSTLSSRCVVLMDELFKKANIS
jgi:hypothetical protein